MARKSRSLTRLMLDAATGIARLQRRAMKLATTTATKTAAANAKALKASTPRPSTTKTGTGKTSALTPPASPRKRGAAGADAAALGSGTLSQGTLARSPLQRSVRRPVPAAPVAAAATGTWVAGVFSTPPMQGELIGRLDYFVYLPSSRPAVGLPLIVMLHGCSQSASDLAAGTRMNRLAEREGFAVLYPQQSRGAQSHRCWRWFQPEAGVGAAEADAIANLADSVTQQYRLDPERRYVAGMSAGAGMAALVALRHAHRFAAVGMHSGAVVGAASSTSAGLSTMRRGTLRDPLSLLAGVLGANTRPGRLEDDAALPALILQGMRDPVVAPRNAEQLTKQFLHVNGMDGETPVTAELAVATPDAYRRLDYRRGNKTVVRVCEIAQLDHAWAGGDPAHRFHARRGPDASALLWRFFRSHRREGATAE